jgi:superfamily II DNA or RNA helicase
MKDYTLKNKRNYVLSEEQNEIVEALLNNDNYFNCAQTGFGKTLTTITAAVHKAVQRKEDDIHFVLLIPPSAEKAFRDTITGILGLQLNTFTATSFRGSRKAIFHIFNYSSITSNIYTGEEDRDGLNEYLRALKKLKQKHKNLWLIADEVHALQDPNSKQYKVVSTIRPLFIGMWGLTATPILNNLDGLYHMTNIVRPGFLGPNIYAFRNMYCTFKDNSFWITRRGKKIKKTKKVVSGYKNLDLLKEKFSKLSIIKSIEYDIEFHYKRTELSEASKKYYKFAAAGLFSGTLTKQGKTKKSKQLHSGARLHDLQRVVSNSHPEFKLLKDPDKITEKEYLLFETIKEVINKDQAVLIYFTYLPTLARIKYILSKVKEGLGIPTVHEVSGNVDYNQRKNVEESIQPRDVVLITSAGTESINLQRANNLIFYETPFPLREFIQACGRIARYNSEYEHFDVFVLEAYGTIDSYKKSRILNHMALIKSLLGKSNTLPVEILILSEADKEDMKKDFLWWKG